MTIEDGQDGEMPTWEGCLHRFNQEEEPIPCSTDGYRYPVPMLRADLISRVRTLVMFV